jgi:hypothetical protein
LSSRCKSCPRNQANPRSWPSESSPRSWSRASLGPASCTEPPATVRQIVACPEDLARGKDRASVPSRHGKGWRPRWVDEHGDRQSRVFKYRRDAEAFERRMKTQVQEVQAGLRAALPLPRTFDDLCDEWESTRALQKRSTKHDRSIIRAHLRPAFTGLKLSDLKAHVSRCATTKSHLAPIWLERATLAAGTAPTIFQRGHNRRSVALGYSPDLKHTSRARCPAIEPPSHPRGGTSHR